MATRAICRQGKKSSDKPKGPVLIRRGAADAVEVWAEILVEPQPKSRIKHMHTHTHAHVRAFLRHQN